MSDPYGWTPHEKGQFLMALRNHGDSDLMLLQSKIPHKPIAEIRGIINHYKQQAQQKWLSEETKKSDEVRNWIEIIERISQRQKDQVEDIIPKVLKYIALFEKKNEHSDINLSEAYTFLSEVSYGKSTKELSERTKYFLYRCLVKLAENLQKQNIDEEKDFLRDLQNCAVLIQKFDKNNPLQVPEELLKMNPLDFNDESGSL